MSKKVKRSRESEARRNSIIRLLVSVFIIILVFASIKWEFGNHFASAVRGVLACVLFIWSLISIVKSFAVIRSSPKNKPEKKAHAKEHEMIHSSLRSRQSKLYDNEASSVKIKSIATLLADNDIIEFEAMVGETIIKFGSSSDLEPGGSVFFDKKYYVGNTEYADLDDMVAAMNKLFPDEIPVLLIDGVKPKYYKIPCSKDNGCL